MNNTNILYQIVNCSNGDIILTPFSIDLTKYDKQLMDDGKIIFKYRNIIEVDMDNLSNYDVKSSSIVKCIINNNVINCSKYRNILDKVYSIIDDGTEIIKNTILNIKTVNRNDSGFKYNSKLGISIQGGTQLKH